LRKALGHGEKGFTLVEVLVVVFFLGLLAAIVIPNVTQFIGEGKIEAANTEARNVQTAVIAYMVDNSLADPGGDTVGPMTDIGPAVADGTTVHSFLLNPGGLQAVYDIDEYTGEMTDAEAIDGSKWGDLEYTKGTGWHEPEPEPE